MNKELYPYINSLDGKRNDIVVKIQPILENFQIYNRSYLSDLDCFHPSAFSNKIDTLEKDNKFYIEHIAKLESLLSDKEKEIELVNTNLFNRTISSWY